MIAEAEAEDVVAAVEVEAVEVEAAVAVDEDQEFMTIRRMMAELKNTSATKTTATPTDGM